MLQHAQNKHLVASFLGAIAEAEPHSITSVLDAYCHRDVVWNAFHPFNKMTGIAEAAETFWKPLKDAFPDYQQRLNLVVANTYERRDWVSTWGHLQGNFQRPWINLPPTKGVILLSFGFNAVVHDNRIAKAYILLDVIDLMRQAGFYPLRKMPGSPEVWPSPPIYPGEECRAFDGERGESSLRIVREMQMGLAQGKDLEDLSKARLRHSPHWHKNMNWYGPAGIGSSRGQRGFLDYHGALFIQAFPDREGIVRAPEGQDERPGHYIRIGDGRLAVTAGWPSLYGTHLGGQWLGVPPSGKKVEMRVADWYRLDENNLIIDNWVMMDLLHILHQAGLNVLDDLRYAADPGLPRWPL